MGVCCRRICLQRKLTTHTWLAPQIPNQSQQEVFRCSHHHSSASHRRHHFAPVAAVGNAFDGVGWGLRADKSWTAGVNASATSSHTSTSVSSCKYLMLPSNVCTCVRACSQCHRSRTSRALHCFGVRALFAHNARTNASNPSIFFDSRPDKSAVGGSTCRVAPLGSGTRFGCGDTSGSLNHNLDLT